MVAVIVVLFVKTIFGIAVSVPPATKPFPPKNLNSDFAMSTAVIVAVPDESPVPIEITPLLIDFIPDGIALEIAIF